MFVSFCDSSPGWERTSGRIVVSGIVDTRVATIAEQLERTIIAVGSGKGVVPLLSSQ